MTFPSLSEKQLIFSVINYLRINKKNAINLYLADSYSFLSRLIKYDEVFPD